MYFTGIPPCNLFRNGLYWGVRVAALTPAGLSPGQPINEQVDDQDDQTGQRTRKNVFPKVRVLNWLLFSMRRRFLLAALFLGHMYHLLTLTIIQHSLNFVKQKVYYFLNFFHFYIDIINHILYV